MHAKNWRGRAVGGGNTLRQVGGERWTDAEVLRHYLEEWGGNVTRAARALGIARPTFWYYLRKESMNAAPAEIRARLRGEVSGAA